MRSLFWKIFLIIWLTNLLIITTGSLMFRLQYQKQYDELAENERVKSFAEYLISRYEAGMDTRDYRRRRRPDDAPLFSIQDLDTGLQVYASEHIKDKDEYNLYSDYVSPIDGHYRIFLYPRNFEPDGPPFPFILLMIGSVLTAIFSWLLTSLITKPLLKLKVYVQGLGGDLSTELEAELLDRQDEFGNLSRAVDEMSSRIRSLIESKQRLFYDVSHELRAPLARMQVASEIVRMRAENKGEDTKIYDRVDREIRALDQLISELLIFAKEDHANFPVEKVDLNKLLNDVVGDQDFSSQQSRQRIQLKLDGGDQTEIDSKLVLLERAIKNLVENAIKYSPEDTPVEVSLTKKNGEFEICVRDFGPGIPEESLELVTNPFTRLHGESVEGVGLGLSIVKRAIGDIGGKLSLANRPEGGLEAKVVLSA